MSVTATELKNNLSEYLSLASTQDIYMLRQHPRRNPAPREIPELPAFRSIHLFVSYDLCHN